ncbi:hypothetical protein P154DRAFT_200507 [Amniculicola lignicola CBS 123094]|uniref:Cytochrome c oxidase assembly protein COX20, mitochondrial n=1 Tax=Amniculicola lignicola CBS 123094 TaxID=1392246 RepID=A0A6A5WFZ0_9PLEO|nr:hypothetical protein P154DRAFT_200507 [Amniculicola lignicola CBS 123094]
MADDTRETSSHPTPPPLPRGPANVMPGGTAHTAGGTPAEAEVPTYLDAVRSLGKDYYLGYYKRPCVRDGQLAGIGAGFVMAGVGAIVRQPVRMCCNLAFWSWITVSCASYQYCQTVRRKEKDGMRQARELMEKKRATIAARNEARRKQREEYEKQLEAQRLEEEKARKSSWKFW